MLWVVLFRTFNFGRSVMYWNLTTVLRIRYNIVRKYLAHNPLFKDFYSVLSKELVCQFTSVSFICIVFVLNMFIDKALFLCTNTYTSTTWATCIETLSNAVLFVLQTFKCNADLLLYTLYVDSNFYFVANNSIAVMNGFNKTEAAVFSCRLCFLRAFSFISFIFT